MRIPLEYGDNFPVPGGGWNPSVPWRFPKQENLPGRRSVWLLRILPWITLGLGVTLGVLWMKGAPETVPQQTPVSSESVLQRDSVRPEPPRPAQRPTRLRSRLA